MNKNFFLLGLYLLLAAIFAEAQTAPTAYLLNVKSAISPATQDYIHRGLERAAKQKSIAIIQLDTPGGLDKSMRGIISDILASPVPVVVYVAPSGARAASAGTYILYAAHVAAMAPGTNIGAATPVGVELPGASAPGEKNEKSSAMEKKALNDAMAYIRGLAQLRGRNAQWAEQAVSKGASISADEALRLKVIDLIAKDIPDLLTKINGRSVIVQNQPTQLATANLSVQEFPSDWRTKFLAVITDPSVAYILLMIGVWGLFFEFANPGFVLPGVAGAISLLLALYAFQLLPINYVGLGLIILGISFMVAEAFVASFGVLGIGGVVALVAGSILLYGPDVPGFLQIAWPIIVTVCLATALFFFLVINIALRARFRPIVSGKEELIGSKGVVVSSNHLTYARIHGELWQVRSEKPLTPGQKVKVVGMKGLILLVESQKNTGDK